MNLTKVSGLLLCLILILGTVGCFDSEQTIKAITITNVDLQSVQDGQYTGEYRANEFVKAVVKVEVKDHIIKEIKLVKHEHGWGEKAEVIPKRVVAKQSLNVDVVSGATVSSKTILKATENALRKGIKQ